MRDWFDVKLIKLARFLLKKVLRDKGFRIAYVANIAMAIYDCRDKNRRISAKNCNCVAEKILVDIFGCED